MVLGRYYYYALCTEEKTKGWTTSRRPTESGQWAARLARAPRELAAAPVWCAGPPLLFPRRRCSALVEGGEFPGPRNPRVDGMTVSASWGPGCGGDASERAPKTSHASVAALRSHGPGLGRPAVRAQASLSNHSGCDLKMDSVLWYSSQSHSTFQSDFKSEPL